MKKSYDNYMDSIPIVFHFRQFLTVSQTAESGYPALLEQWQALGKPSDWHSLPMGSFGITEEIAQKFGMKYTKQVKGSWFYFSELERAIALIASEYACLGMAWMMEYKETIDDENQNL